LQLYREFARAFIDDIVVFSKIALKHVYYLCQVLSLFAKIGLSLSLAKSFLAYPLVQLLSYRVDGLSILTTEERVAAIRNIIFLCTLKELETFVGITGFLK
jgi:hypothetical protein